MTIAMIDAGARAPAHPPALAGILTRDPLFAATGLLMLALMAPTVFAFLVEARVLDGDNLWLKPLKFQLSLALYLITLAFFARFIPATILEARRMRIYAVVVVGAIVLEMAWLMLAAGQGVPSHFNETTPFWTNAYRLMGVLAVTLASASLVYGWMIHRNEATGLSPAIKASIVHGLVLTFVLTVMAAGFMAVSGGRHVGVEVAAPAKLAVMGWARAGGDLRVAHFFATHAMQFIPAFGVVSAALFGRDNIVPIRIFSVLFSVFTVAVLAQALAGRPFP
jgi:hypothetical protein